MFRRRLIDSDKDVDKEEYCECIIDNGSMLFECMKGCVNGIFYFTKDERLQDSQPCGHCHGTGWIDCFA